MTNKTYPIPPGSRIAGLEPAWRQASREQAEQSRIVFPEPMPISLLERAQYWAAIANGSLDEWEKQKQDHP